MSTRDADVKATRDPKAYAERQGKRMTMKKDSKKRKIKSFAWVTFFLSTIRAWWQWWKDQGEAYKEARIGREVRKRRLLCFHYKSHYHQLHYYTHICIKIYQRNRIINRNGKRETVVSYRSYKRVGVLNREAVMERSRLRMKEGSGRSSRILIGVIRSP